MIRTAWNWFLQEHDMLRGPYLHSDRRVIRLKSQENSWAKYGKAELRQKEILNYFHPVTNFIFALQFNL